jgi:hypothetical protein
MNSQRAMVEASWLATGGTETERHAVYAERRTRVRRLDDLKRAPMRPAGVRKMRQSRKRRAGTIR